jgi:hypothetical protein
MFGDDKILNQVDKRFMRLDFYHRGIVAKHCKDVPETESF